MTESSNVWFLVGENCRFRNYDESLLFMQCQGSNQLKFVFEKIAPTCTLSCNSFIYENIHKCIIFIIWLMSCVLAFLWWSFRQRIRILLVTAENYTEGNDKNLTLTYILHVLSAITYRHLLILYYNFFRLNLEDQSCNVLIAFEYNL